jgi:purine catabolism regulator
MYPTVAQVLALDALRRGRPRVVAGAGGLARQVRWTHVAELPDIAHLLRGGELLLSTGVALPDDDDQLRSFVSDLEAARVAGLVIELGRRYQSALPASLVTRAEELGLPVVQLARETRFVQVTEAVHALIVNAQVAELRMSDEVHRTFTELSVEGASLQAIVRHTARMANAPVVLENLSHQVLAFDAAGASAEAVLDRWESRSRSVAHTGRSSADEDLGWVVATVGARGVDWGRLVLVREGSASPQDAVLVERAAATLALARLLQREQESLEQQSHRNLLTAIVNQELTSDEIQLRARSLGVPLENKQLVAVLLRPGTLPHAPLEAQARLRSVADAATESVRGTRGIAIVGVLDEGTVGLVLATSERQRLDALLDEVSTKIRSVVRSGGDEDADLLVAAGSQVDDVLSLRRSFLEATHVADVAGAPDDRALVRLSDVGLAGLMHLLRDDERLQTYVERELGPLLAKDSGDDDRSLLGVLRVYLAAGRNKSVAAARSGLSRPTFYERIRQIERILERDLDDESTLLSLHVAVVALDAIRSPS